MVLDPGTSREAVDGPLPLRVEGTYDRYLPCVSLPMQVLAASLSRVAATRVPILIGGETGSGKSTLARQVHEDSSHRETPLIVLHSPTVTTAAMEGLQRVGAATVLIEEVGDLSAPAQDALIRVLSSQPASPGLRLIATTSCDLAELAQRHGLRPDLLYRLDVVRLDIPPLRQRPEDIVFLAEHFMMIASRSFKRDVRGLSPDACERLLQHRWPGNVHELRNCIIESVLYCPHIRLRADDLRLRNSVGVVDPEAELAAALARLHASSSEDFYEHAQRVLLQWALHACGGNRVRTASFLGIGRGALRAKLRRFGQG
ncbi:MAG: sigma-54-dependent Fis family transcriptional regulator [Deltaproteobacteria bacterium]|nr:sigma-54-dependent Fis family transcriptional regulator [Deltaproteobacteria bacterium]